MTGNNISSCLFLLSNAQVQLMIALLQVIWSEEPSRQKPRDGSASKMADWHSARWDPTSGRCYVPRALGAETMIHPNTISSSLLLVYAAQIH